MLLIRNRCRVLATHRYRESLTLASAALPSAARALRLLWAVEQLSLPEEFPAAGAVHLVLRATATESAVHDLDCLWAAAYALSPSECSDHASLCDVTPASGLPSGRAVCGKSARTDL